MTRIDVRENHRRRSRGRRYPDILAGNTVPALAAVAKARHDSAKGTIGNVRP